MNGELKTMCDASFFLLVNVKIMLKFTFLKFVLLFNVSLHHRNKQIEIMTRLQTLENRLKRLVENKDSYVSSIKINGKIYANPKQARYCMVSCLIRKEIRTILN